MRIATARTLVMLMARHKLLPVIALTAGVTRVNNHEAAQHLGEDYKLAKDESGWRLHEAMKTLGMQPNTTATRVSIEAEEEPLPRAGDKIVVLVFDENTGKFDDNHYVVQISASAA